jgi:hypothetical protein
MESDERKSEAQVLRVRVRKSYGDISKRPLKIIPKNNSIMNIIYTFWQCWKMFTPFSVNGFRSICHIKLKQVGATGIILANGRGTISEKGHLKICGKRIK